MSGAVLGPPTAIRRGDARAAGSDPAIRRARSRDAAAVSRPLRACVAVSCALATAGGRGRPAAAAFRLRLT